jgi:hypothetical protein
LVTAPPPSSTVDDRRPTGGLGPVEAVDIGQPTVPHHLKVLAEIGFVHGEARANTTQWSVRGHYAAAATSASACCLSVDDRDRQNSRRRAWEKQAARCDKQMSWWERQVLGEDNRAWACGRAHGDVLDVAIGTGLNIPFYGPETRIVGVDLRPAMLDIARRRAKQHGRHVDLREVDAHHLAFDDESFDAVVCTFSLATSPTRTKRPARCTESCAPGVG